MNGKLNSLKEGSKYFMAIVDQINRITGKLNGNGSIEDALRVLELNGSSEGLTATQKNAILNCFEHVAWTDTSGQSYYNELHAALFPPAELSYITAVYSNSGTVYPDESLENLKQYITVTAHYNDSSTTSVNAYTLTGVLEVGQSVLTISYSEKTTTVTVTVSTKPKSDMTEWNSGIAYTDIEVVQNSYYSSSGNITAYNGWDRTGKIPIHGASTIVFEPYGSGNSSIDLTYCWFFDENGDPLSKFDTLLPELQGGTEEVPSGAYYFGFSGSSARISAIIENGFTPYA